MQITHYKLINIRAKWLGLDFFDVVAIVILFAVVNLLTSAILADLVICLLLYVGLRILKATKPKGWFLNVLRYYLQSPYYRTAATRINRYDCR